MQGKVSPTHPPDKCLCHPSESDSKAPNAVITIAIQLRYDYDPTTTYRTPAIYSSTRFDASKKVNMLIFRRSCVVVVS